MRTELELIDCGESTVELLEVPRLTNRKCDFRFVGMTFVRTCGEGPRGQHFSGIAGDGLAPGRVHLLEPARRAAIPAAQARSSMARLCERMSALPELTKDLPIRKMRLAALREVLNEDWRRVVKAAGLQVCCPSCTRWTVIGSAEHRLMQHGFEFARLHCSMSGLSCPSTEGQVPTNWSRPRLLSTAVVDLA